MTLQQSTVTQMMPTVDSRLPWPAVAACLIALAAFWISFGFSPLLPIFALAITASRFLPYRIGVWWMHWLARLVLLGGVVTLYETGIGQGEASSIDISGLQLVGALALAELALQCWMAWRGRSSLGFVMLLSGILFLIGCTTWNDTLIRFIAPAYMLFAIAALPMERMPDGKRGGRVKAVVLICQVVAVLLALLAGAAADAGVWANRAQLTQWGDNLLENRRMPEQAGVSTNPYLGGSFGQQGSPSRVLLIVGPLADPHLRGLSFDTYSRGSWQPGLNERQFVAFPSAHPASPSEPTAQVTALYDSSGLIYAPLCSAQIVSSGPLSWSPSSGAAVRTQALAPYTYTLAGSTSSDAQGPLCLPLGADERRRCLAVPPEIAPGVKTLAARIGGGLSTPQQKITAVTGYLESHYTYSLAVHPGPGDPVSNFLLHGHSAYCEYFASAAAILLRCLGVPTRYVVGYYAHETNGDVTVVRQWDAHAWAESWMDGVGWVTVEATPPTGRPNQAGHHLPFWTKTWERILDLQAFVRAKLAALNAVQIAELATGGILVVLLLRWLVLLGLQKWRKRPGIGGFAYFQPEEALRLAAGRFEALMLRAGAACPENRTWREHLAGPMPPNARFDLKVAHAFMHDYDAARFGPPADDRLIRELEDRLQELEVSLRSERR